MQPVGRGLLSWTALPHGSTWGVGVMRMLMRKLALATALAVVSVGAFGCLPSSAGGSNPLNDLLNRITGSDGDGETADDSGAVGGGATAPGNGKTAPSDGDGETQ